MRGILGGLALVAGVAGLGIWGAKDHAVDMEAKIAAGASKAVAGSVHGVTAMVDGRDITVRGIADTEAERDTLVAALNEVNGRRVVRDELTVLPRVAPFTFTARREAGATTLSGYVPSEADRAALGDGAAALGLATGAPEGWLGAAETSVASLVPLESGEAVLSDQELSLVGLAATPAEKAEAEALLAGLPEGYTVGTDIEVLDDGKPDFELSYKAASGASLQGKLPDGLDAQGVAAALGLGSVSGDVPTSFAADAGALDDLQALAGWLPEFDSLTLSRQAGESAVWGVLQPGVDGELVLAGMTEDLAGGSVIVIEMEDLPEEGSLRINAATGLEEVFKGGFWLPNLSFEPDLQVCDAKAGEILTGAKINFVTGSARLGARATRSINALAAVIERCVAGGLRLELGGHTDNTGDTGANLALSSQRARAVRDALAARGVPAGAMLAVGHGDTLPIADNTTEEGRAANRRTTITWSK